MKTAVLLAGEKSGDLIGGEICIELKKLGFEIFGIGGEEMLKNGLSASFFNIKEISVMGFLEVLPKAIAIKKRIKQTAQNILELNPDFVLTIDAPGFNTRVVSQIKGKFKGKIFHAVAPTVWAWKEKRAKKFAKLFDMLFCILPFEPPYFLKEGLKAEYICYPPLFRILKDIEDIKNYKKDFILFTLGSRETEVLQNIELAKSVVSKIKNAIPDAKFVFPTFDEFKEIIQQAFPTEITAITKEERLFYAKRAKFSISKSGTGAVEASFFEIPSVVFYKINLLSYYIIKAMAKINMVNLINILLKKEIIPEFTQFNATATKIAGKSIEIMQSKAQQEQQIAEVLKAKEMLLKSPYNSFGEGVVKLIIQNL